MASNIWNFSLDSFGNSEDLMAGMTRCLFIERVLWLLWDV